MPDAHPTEEEPTVTDALWTWGWWMLLLASGLGLGLIIGAESTSLVLVQAQTYTPGVFGPNVAVGPDFLKWWEASKALAIVGGAAMLAGYLFDEYYDNSAA
jgi:hypothetical protein